MSHTSNVSECGHIRNTHSDLSLDTLIRYEEGALDEDETLELFAALVETGVAWQLQGHYGRTAQQLIDAGLIGSPVR